MNRKNLTLLAAFAVLVTFGLSSCSECVKCKDCSGLGALVEGTKLCEEDYATTAEYEADIAAFESTDPLIGLGCTCK